MSTENLHSPVVARLSDVLDIVLELGLGAARPEGDDDPVVQRQRDPLPIAAHRQRSHAVGLSREGGGQFSRNNYGILVISSFFCLHFLLGFIWLLL